MPGSRRTQCFQFDQWFDNCQATCICLWLNKHFVSDASVRKKESRFYQFKYHSICLSHSRTHIHTLRHRRLTEVFTESPGCWRQAKGLMHWKSSEGLFDDVFYCAITLSLSSLKSPSTVAKTCIKQHLRTLHQSLRRVSGNKHTWVCNQLIYCICCGCISVVYYSSWPFTRVLKLTFSLHLNASVLCRRDKRKSNLW